MILIYQESEKTIKYILILRNVVNKYFIKQNYDNTRTIRIYKHHL